MRYAVILVTNDRQSAAALRRAIEAAGDRFELAMQTNNAVEAVSAAEDIHPHILILKEGLNFYNAGQLIRDMVGRNPLIRYILLGGRIREALEPELEAEVSARLQEDAPEAEVRAALETAAADYEKRRAAQGGGSGFPAEMGDRYAHWLDLNALFARILNGTVTPERLTRECPVLSAGRYVLIISKLCLQEAAFFSYYQDIAKLSELYARLRALLLSYGDGLIFVASEVKLCFLVSVARDVPWTEERLEPFVAGFLQKANRVCDSLGMPRMQFCRSGVETGFDGMARRYRDVDALVKYHFFTGGSQVISSAWLVKNTRELDVEAMRQLLTRLEESLTQSRPEALTRVLEEIRDTTAQTLSFNSFHYVWGQLAFLHAVQVNRYALSAQNAFPLAWNESFPDIQTAFDHLNDQFLQLFSAVPRLRGTSDNPHIANALDYIRGHMGGDTGLAAVAKAIHVSPAYLSHLFQREFARTFVDYCNELRVSCAAESLARGEKVYEAAQKAGFDNAKYFSRIFRRYRSVTPREYQQRCKAALKEASR